jgi:uncharacterized lipoprotein YajG
VTGSLPGGVDAEALQKLTSNQELMDLMANDKLQEFMKAVMEQDMAAMQRFAADQEVLQMMQRFQQLAMEVRCVALRCVLNRDRDCDSCWWSGEGSKTKWHSFYMYPHLD